MRKFRHIHFLILVCIGYFTSHAQNIYFNKSWTSPPQEGFSSCVQVNDSGYYVIGTESLGNSKGIYIFRTDKNGDTLWTKRYSMLGIWYYTGLAGSLIKTNDGNFAFGGSRVVAGDTVNTSDMFLMKFDSNGDTLWTKTIGGPYWDAGRQCVQTADGGYAIIGDTELSAGGFNDFLLVKTDALGNVQWQQTYNGVNNMDVGFCLEQTFEGGYILSGYKRIGSGSDYDHWIIKTDNLGNTQWTRTYGTPGDDNAAFVTQAADSGYIIAGSWFNAADGFYDGCLRKIDKNGNQQWFKIIGTQTMDWFYTIPLELPDGSIVAAGEKFVGVPYGWLVKTDPSGNEIWQRTYYMNPVIDNYFWDLKHTSDNGFVMCGQTYGSLTDPWLIKVDSNGCLVQNCNVGMEVDLGNRVLEIFPNPVADELFIRLPFQRELEVSIINETGQEVYFERENTTLDVKKIALSEFCPGLYVVLISSGEVRYSQTFLKVK